MVPYKNRRPHMKLWMSLYAMVWLVFIEFMLEMTPGCFECSSLPPHRPWAFDYWSCQLQLQRGAFDCGARTGEAHRENNSQPVQRMRHSWSPSLFRHRGSLADSLRSHLRGNYTLPPRDDRVRNHHAGCRGGHRL